MPASAQDAACPEFGAMPRIAKVSFAPARVPVAPDGNIVGEDVSLRFTISRGHTDFTPTAWLFEELAADLRAMLEVRSS